LSLSRLAYDLESVISPMVAALLLTVVSFHSLFGGTALGFVISAALVASVTLPVALMGPKKSIYERITKGMRIFLATPRLRGLLTLNLAIAAAGAMVIVNTVVLVQSRFGLTQSSTATALMVFGGGSMLVALILPRLLDRLDDRRVMLAGGAVLVAGLCLGMFLPGYTSLLALWFLLGAGYSLAQTPTGRVLRRSSSTQDRPALFAAQFALSHACWLITYPLAGWVGANWGLTASFVGLSLLALVALIVSLRIWQPDHDREVIEHHHDNLPEDHPHILDGRTHAHAFVIDDEHQRWPRN